MSPYPNRKIAIVILLLLSPVCMAQSPAFVPPESELIDAAQLLRDLEVLSADDMEGRRPDTAGAARARDYIVRRFSESGILPFGDSYLRPFTFSFRGQRAVSQGINVAGYIQGKTNPRRFLVITAHYDHVGIQRGRIYNGANDNASGVAALFALAAYFEENRPENSILFAALDAEESGMLGARAFLRDPPVAGSAMIMNVNVDMICRDKDRTLYAAGAYHYPFLRPHLETILPDAPVRLLLGHDRPDQPEDWTSDSDHIEFHRAGIPFIYFGVEDYEHHHQPTDVFGSIMPDFYAGAVETVIMAVQEFDRHL